MNRVRFARMKKTTICVLWLLIGAVACRAQSMPKDGNFALALPAHQGQLTWTAQAFAVVQNSAKPNGGEIGVRATDASGKYTLLGFLFLFPEQSPMTSAKCRDGVMEPLKKSNPTISIAGTSEMARSDGPPLELVGYVAQGRDGNLVYAVRGFIATGDLCGDLEIYGDDVSAISDPNLKKIWQSYRLDPQYVPQFNDVFAYAQILYENEQYEAAAPMFEESLSKLNDAQDKIKWRRVATDQAGMAYGIAGNIPKARALFNAAIAKDPDYPMYYYELACADAEEKKLDDARTHLQQAFARKANVIAGETMPDPTKDDSFLPYRNNKEFWTFLESLR
jgi:tetratricopeptide (TPR) repeat protein